MLRGRRPIYLYINISYFIIYYLGEEESFILGQNRDFRCIKTTLKVYENTTKGVEKHH